MLRKAYKFRIYPSTEQITLIERSFGCARMVANLLLASQKREEEVWQISEELFQSGALPANKYKTPFFNKVQMIKELPKLKVVYPFLKEVDSIALQSSVEDLANAYERYYKKASGKPQFRKKFSKQSYTTKSVNGNISLKGNKIKLPKLGFIEVARSLKVNGIIKRVTVSRNSLGKYFVSILTEQEIKTFPKTNSEVGIDLGLLEFLTLSDGSVVKNPRQYQYLETKLAKAQRKLSRRKLHSQNYKKQRKVVAKIHEKIANQRKDFLHKLSTHLIKNHDFIGLENLNVKRMVESSDLAKSIADVSWGEFVRMLTYKANWYGKIVVQIDQYFPSSQMCSYCKTINPKVKNLLVRKWTCDGCGVNHVRDVNAAINILNEAKRIYEKTFASIVA